MELPEERFKKRPWVRRVAFWSAVVLAIVTLTGYSFRDIFKDDIRAPVSQAATAPSSAKGVFPPQGWGPDRDIFTKEQRPTFAVLNSISNAQNYGDERNWVTAQVSSDEDWSDDVNVKPGDVVKIRFYYANSARDDLVDSPASWIQGARLRIRYTTGPAQTLIVQGFLSAANAALIWDTATVHSTANVTLSPVNGSAILSNQTFPPPAVEGLKLNAADLFSEQGGLLGDAGLDGVIKPGYKYCGAVFVDFAVEAASS